MFDEFSFGAWVRRRRRTLDLTQAELAKRIGCATVTIQKIERDERRPSLQIAELLAEQLQLSAELRGAFLHAARAETSVDRLSAAATTPPDHPPAAPTGGLVTVVCCDIPDAARMRDAAPQELETALARYAAIVTAAIANHQGQILSIQATVCQARFADPAQAIKAAITIQHAMVAETWPQNESLTARIALHTGSVASADQAGGPARDHADRLRDASHGGQILVSHVTAELVRDTLPQGVALQNLGLFHFSHAGAPEQLFQLVVPNLPQIFPPPLALNVRLSNLPAQLNRMIDRIGEIDELTALLRAGKRMVTITGPGGVGKTRLALQLAIAHAADYPDGVWFVDLSPVHNPAQLAIRVAHALGRTAPASGNLEEQLLQWLRYKHLLLVLDNAEQALDCAELLARWLRAAPYLTILVSSRVPFRMTSEQEYPIAPLLSPEPYTLTSLAQVQAYDAVTLFTTRAQEVNPHFTLTNRNVAEVAEICWQLDGLPLAIELAAARMRIFSPRQLLTQLRDNGMLLNMRSNARDIPQRQQTLQATLMWSYNLLNPAEQALLARISVFVSGWTFAALEAICADADARIGTETILNLLERLVEHSLVQHVAPDGPHPRFALLRSIREFAQQQLEARGETDTIQRRHAEFYIALANAARDAYDRGNINAFAPIHEDLDNFRSALDWALDHDMLTPAVETVVRLGPFWSSRMPVTLEWLETVLARAEDLPPALRAALLSLMSVLSWELYRDPRHARKLGEASAALYRELHDQHGLATAITGLAYISIALGDLDSPQIQAYLDDSMALRRALDDRAGIAEILLIQGRIATLQSEFTRAHELMKEALALRRAEGAPLGIAVALFYLGWLAYHENDYPQMEAASRERLTIEQAMGNPQGVADCHLWLGVAALWRGDTAHGLALLESALAQLRMLNDPHNLIHVLDACAHSAVTAGNLSVARQYQMERLALLDSLGYYHSAIWSRIHLGAIALAEADAQAARAHLQAARTQLHEDHSPYGVTQLFSDLAPRSDDAARALYVETRAALALQEQRPEAAARLAAAGAALRAAQRIPFYFPDERDMLTATVAAARAALGATAFDAAWAAGAALPWDAESDEAAVGAAYDAPPRRE